MRRKIKEMKLTLDSTVFITIEETLFNTINTRMNDLSGEGVVITNSTLDREKRDEREVASMKKELDHLQHQVEYYQNLTEVVVLLKSEL
jgi:hypothetical protein